MKITVQLDLEPPFTMVSLTHDATFESLHNLRVAIAAATKLATFTRDERHAMYELLTSIDSALDGHF